MATTEFSFSDNVFVFETVMRIRNTEIDVGQYLTIEAMSSLLSEAKARFLYSKGLKPINSDYQGLFVSDFLLNMVSRVRAREELLFEVGVENLTDEGGDICFKVSRMYDGSLVAKAMSHFKNYDYRLNKVIPLSAYVKELLQQQAAFEI